MLVLTYLISDVLNQFFTILLPINTPTTQEDMVNEMTAVGRHPRRKSIRLFLFESAITRGNKHNLFSCKIRLLNISPERCCRAEHPGR